MVPMFRIMASMRRLRGTKLDLFGLFPERRMERALISEFEETVEKLLSVLDKENIGDAETVIRLYMDIRGYGPVKEQAAHDVRGKIAAHAIMQS
jgi:indolepyruvate ferredoxin oxidoreductase